MGAIQPQVMRWARETAGLSLQDAAHAIGLNAAHGLSGAERLGRFETGELDPSRKLLAKMAKAYRRPLLVFYLSQPPKTGDRGHDFRTLPDAEKQNPELDALIRDIKGRQGLVKSVLEDEETERISFVGTATMDVPVPELAKRITKTLNFSLAGFRREKSGDAAFGYLRTQIEAAGVFVLLLGNLGSHHTNIPLEVFRGFAIADVFAPMIVINDQDAKPAWSFTALHELVHLWLGTTGISGTDATERIEQYCNDVAGEILVPAEEVRNIAHVNTFDAAVKQITEFAEERRVSRAMVAYKLLHAGKISRAMWILLAAHFRKAWLELKQKQAEKKKASDTGPNYYVVRRHRVGAALIHLVRRAIDDGNLTYTKAGRVLGVRPRSVEPLLSTGQIRGTR